MNESTVNNYYYGDESNQFSFFRIPRQLITGDRFKHISTDAKLLYGLLLDRMGLSEQNGWYDENGRVFIYYTLREIQKNLNCGQDKAIKLLAELDKGKNFISSAAAGSTMTGGDGSTWRKNNDGTTTITKGGQTWTYGTASSGGSSGGGSSGGSGNVSVTLPNGTKTSTSYVNGRVTGNLPIGSIIHTAGGDYQITGGSAGNYTSTRYTGSTAPAQNVDYSDLINQAINSGASWEDVQSLLDQRNAKIGADPNLSKYLYDENYARAMQYIYTKQQNEAQLKANLAELEGAYQSSLAGYESTRNQIAPTYQAQRNQTAASSDVNWNGFNEVAAANGLNTGAVGQAALSRAVTLQNNMNALNQSEAEELSKIDLEVAQLTAEYNSAIAKAKASGDADLAAALYQQFNDYITRKQTERDNAQALQQAQQEAQAAAQQDAYEVALDLITSGIMPTASQLAAAGMTRADAESLYYQVMAQQAAKSSGRSGGSGGGSSRSSSRSSSGSKSTSGNTNDTAKKYTVGQTASTIAEFDTNDFANSHTDKTVTIKTGANSTNTMSWTMAENLLKKGKLKAVYTKSGWELSFA